MVEMHDHYIHTSREPLCRECYSDRNIRAVTVGMVKVSSHAAATAFQSKEGTSLKVLANSKSV